MNYCSYLRDETRVIHAPKSRILTYQNVMLLNRPSVLKNWVTIWILLNNFNIWNFNIYQFDDYLLQCPALPASVGNVNLNSFLFTVQVLVCNLTSKVSHCYPNFCCHLFCHPFPLLSIWSNHASVRIAVLVLISCFDLTSKYWLVKYRHPETTNIVHFFFF